ncbi:DODA-type extradiol aromatic ring-opening family dioxygenase [Gluconobacter wancherniae]|uniref:DODA-type extradiol aromatic ring-opening family dioxygenase n=1 Tax=Gluconobacter wancherniae TaxID=1307955 RepID=UPI001B8B51E7|nr:class III extradiol ring-cleavage dioxygenase [Gluconobacter wancherniae]MBS1088004.1 dioxygenase [Gluconobacter wancherniae]
MTEQLETHSVMQPVLFLPHGGGPCFFMDGAERWSRMEAYLSGVRRSLPRKPSAILVISGHWENTVPTVTSSPNPALIYDYYGFPEHTYRLKYPAPGAPQLAEDVCRLLQQAGIASASDAERGFDHGVFVPFLVAFPEADIPVVELSLQKDLDPVFHLKVGEALSELRSRNILIVATGMTYHNLRSFMTHDPRAAEASVQFDDWLTEVIEDTAVRRNSRLSNWETAPAARLCHPREEHLLPLMVAAGAAGDDLGVHDYRDVILGKTLSGYRFG